MPDSFRDRSVERAALSGALDGVSGSLSDGDLLALLLKDEEAAAGWQSSTLSTLRQKALDYYDRKRLGDETERLRADRHLRVRRRDRTDHARPVARLHRSNDLVRFVPLKDALMYRLGGLTVDVEDMLRKRVLVVQGLSRDGLDVLLAELGG